ncbi:MAG: hypothetical protein JSS96_17290 [Bacteroidetes bacterium]|nr:hypothetical protein [Bacteroidota bacterium]
MKVIRLFIESLYWLNIFIVPVIFIGGSSFLLYYNYPAIWSLIIFLFLGALSIILGIYWAEKIRKTIGCSVFVNRIFWSPDANDKEDESEKNSSK